MIPTAQRLEGIGEYWFSKKLDEVRAMNARGLDIVNLGIGSPDLAPSKATLQAAAQALQNEKNHGYASYRSTPELREAIAQWYVRTYQVIANPASEILPLLGSKEGILYLSLAFLNPGDTVLVPDPGYPAYTSAAKLAGAQVLPYDLKETGGWLPDFDAIEKSMRLVPNPLCKIMWVNYPHMPTGRAGNANLFKQLIAFAKKHNILIAHDNPYGLVLNETPPISILQFDGAKDVCVELNSMSKAFNMAGWRVGMLMANAAIVDAVVKVKSQVDSGMFLPVQAAAAEALGNSAEWHNERNSVYAGRRKLVREILDLLGFEYAADQVGLFVWAKAPKRVPDVEAYLNRLLTEARVFLTPGFIFGSNGAGFARASLCATEERLKLALDRIREWGPQ